MDVEGIFVDYEEKGRNLSDIRLAARV